MRKKNSPSLFRGGGDPLFIEAIVDKVFAIMDRPTDRRLLCVWRKLRRNCYSQPEPDLFYISGELCKNWHTDSIPISQSVGIAYERKWLGARKREHVQRTKPLTPKACRLHHPHKQNPVTAIQRLPYIGNKQPLPFGLLHVNRSLLPFLLSFAHVITTAANGTPAVGAPRRHETRRRGRPHMSYMFYTIGGRLPLAGS